MLLRLGRSNRRVLSCIFCGKTNLTREHIFPRWAWPYFDQLPRTRAGISVALNYPDRVDIGYEGLLKGAVRDWEVRCVCGGLSTDCNSGWMKDIEDAARPILLPMIQGANYKERLFPEDLNIIATWAALKVIIADRVEGGAWAVHHAQRRFMFTHHQPPLRNWSIWLGRYERRDWKGEWISRPFATVPLTRPERAGHPVSHNNGNSVTQVIGQVLIHVIHSINQRLIKDWRFSVPQGRTLSAPLFRIWPPVKTSISWPPAPLSDADADFISVALSNFLNRNTAEFLSRTSAQRPS